MSAAWTAAGHRLGPLYFRRGGGFPGWRRRGRGQIFLRCWRCIGRGLRSCVDLGLQMKSPAPAMCRTQATLFLERLSIKCSTYCLTETWARNSYPIMASKHEVISSEASIPVRMLLSNDVDIIGSRIFHETPFMGFRHVDHLSYHRHAERKKEQMSFVLIQCPKTANLHVRNEYPLDRICMLAGAKVEHRGIAFFVDEHLQFLLHLQVAPNLVTVVRLRRICYNERAVYCIKRLCTCERLWGSNTLGHPGHNRDQVLVFRSGLWIR